MLAILGPGNLGQSAAQWAAECGLPTRLLGRDLEHAEAGVRAIRARWDRAIARGRLSPEAGSQCLGLLQAAPYGTAALADASSFLEAVPEDRNLKTAVLRAAAQNGPADLLLLSGTSALPIGMLAEGSGTAGRLIGFHLFLPVPRMGVVEMALPSDTAPQWVSKACDLAASLRKRVVQVKDQPGFAAARMALALGLEAMRLVEAGVATADDLDALMTLGYGHPAGPLEVSDRVGLDLRLRIAQLLHAAGEHRFEPPRSLVEKAREGQLGRKSGQGFHTWDDPAESSGPPRGSA